MHSDTIQTITNTDGLLLMAKIGVKMNYNRQVDVEKLKEQLAPDGIHMETMKFIHEHRFGKPVDPHYRLMWMVMTKEYQKGKKGLPPQITFDTTIEAYELAVTTSDKLKSSEEILDEKIMEALSNG